MKYCLVVLSYVFIGIIIIGWAFGYRDSIPTDTILAITAVILAWYTWETSEIRKVNTETLKRQQQPVAGCFLSQSNPDDPMDISFIIKNQSSGPVAVKVNISITFDNVRLERFHDEYQMNKVLEFSF